MDQLLPSLLSMFVEISKSTSQNSASKLASKHSLLNHIFVAHKLLKCYYCRQTFDALEDRNNHMQSEHTEASNRLKRLDLYDVNASKTEKNLVCEFCSKTFKLQTVLDVHRRTHTGEKPYNCEECGKTFAQGAHLTLHKRCHTGERPYSCDICNKRFASKGNCDAHKLTHSGIKPFICVVCAKAFGTPRTLKKHMLAHQEEN